MPIDVEKLREKLNGWRNQFEGWTAPDDWHSFVNENDVEAMLTEIEQLRAENLKLFTALKSLQSYAANGDVFYPCDDEREDHEWSTNDSSAHCIHCGLHIDVNQD